MISSEKLKIFIKEEKIKIIPYNPKNFYGNKYMLHLGEVIAGFKHDMDITRYTIEDMDSRCFFVYPGPEGFLLQPFSPYSLKIKEKIEYEGYKIKIESLIKGYEPIESESGFCLSGTSPSIIRIAPNSQIALLSFYDI